MHHLEEIETLRSSDMKEGLREMSITLPLWFSFIMVLITIFIKETAEYLIGIRLLYTGL